MSERIEVELIDSVYMRIKADAGLKTELSDFFAFKCGKEEAGWLKEQL
jgi:hypothetical protein